jgi:hypothetical protein
VRFLYLDNQLLGSLANHPQLSQQLLLAGAMGRLVAMDNPGAGNRATSHITHLTLRITDMSPGTKGRC